MPIPTITIRKRDGWDKTNPFDHPPRDRPLRILVDQRFSRSPLDDSSPLVQTDQTADPDGLLRGLLHHPSFNVTWVSDTLEPGTLRIGEVDASGDVLTFEVRKEATGYVAGVWPYQQWVNEVRVYGDEADSALDDFMLARIAVEIDADVLVTKRPRLLDTKKPLIAEANAMTPADALALVGLFLRCRDDYTILGPSRYRSQKWIVYWVGARDLLSEGWRWMSACVAHSGKTNDDTATLLAGSGHQRIARALMERDELHRLLFLPQDNNTQGDVLAQLDWFLVSLVGAFDVAARVAHLACGFDPAKRKDASWKKQGWMKQLTAQAPKLVASVASGTETRDALDLCGPLRNSIHGEALQGIAHRSSAQMETLIQIPPGDLADLLTIVQRRGGEARWGIRQSGSTPYINAGVFVDTLLPFVCQALNELMRLTPVEQLDGGQAAIKSDPPDDRLFGEGMRSRVRLLLGTGRNLNAP